jgi:hypothetical protein
MVEMNEKADFIAGFRVVPSQFYAYRDLVIYANDACSQGEDIVFMLNHLS